MTDPTTAVEELDARLDEFDTGPSGLPRDDNGFPYLANDRHAEWALRRLGEHQATAARIRREAADRIAVIEAWAADLAGPEDDSAGFFEGLLADYHRRAIDIAKANGVKAPLSMKFPHGTLTSRAGRPSIVVDDNDKAVSSLLAVPFDPEWRPWRDVLEQALKVTTTLSKSGLDDIADVSLVVSREDGTYAVIDEETGETFPIEGVRQVVGDRTFTAKPSAAGL